jgi:hypothetical protein
MGHVTNSAEVRHFRAVSWDWLRGPRTALRLVVPHMTIERLHQRVLADADALAYLSSFDAKDEAKVLLKVMADHLALPGMNPELAMRLWAISQAGDQNDPNAAAMKHRQAFMIVRVVGLIPRSRQIPPDGVKRLLAEADPLLADVSDEAIRATIDHVMAGKMVPAGVLAELHLSLEFPKAPKKPLERKQRSQRRGALQREIEAAIEPVRAQLEAAAALNASMF